MPYTPHVEQHFTSGLVVRDAVIGLSDGLTVPFALAAGLTGAVDSTAVVVTAGLAEIVAGSIAMGLGGYLAGKSVVEPLRRRPEAWRDFMMRFELGLEQPDPRRAVTSGAVIAAAYIAGGLIPLCPYMLLPSAHSALPWSIAVTGTALAVFGWIRGRLTGVWPVRTALQTILIGGLAAAAAFVIARAIS